MNSYRDIVYFTIYIVTAQFYYKHMCQSNTVIFSPTVLSKVHEQKDHQNRWPLLETSHPS